MIEIELQFGSHELMEAPSVDTDDYPGIRKEDIRLLESAHVFVPVSVGFELLYQAKWILCISL